MYMHREHIPGNLQYRVFRKYMSAASLTTIKIDPSYDYIILPYYQILIKQVPGIPINFTGFR